MLYHRPLFKLGCIIVVILLLVICNYWNTSNLSDERLLKPYGSNREQSIDRASGSASIEHNAARYVRCAEQYLGCFCDKNKAIVYDKESLKHHSTVKECLVECSERKKVLVAVAEQECKCGDRFYHRKPLKTSNQCREKSITYPEHQCQADFTSFEVYRILNPCIRGAMTDEELSKKFLGNFFLSDGFEQEAFADKSNVTSKQCYLHCEENEHTLAMMTSDDRICYCGHTTQRFHVNKPLLATEMKTRRTVAVWRTLVQDYRCLARKFLPVNSTEGVYLRSFPGSGNTWTRFLIECATGIFTGSDYFDGPIQAGGMLGEFDSSTSGRTIAIKSHGDSRKSTKTIALVRSPFDAIMSEYKRRRFRSHTKSGNYIFNSTEWLGTMWSLAKIWVRRNIEYFTQSRELLVVYYEDLKEDHIKVIRKVVEFIGYKVEDLEERLLCLETEGTGLFKRSSAKKFNPYAKNHVKHVNRHIAELREYMEANNITPALPEYERTVES